jgi:hypothetical protein
LLSSSSAREREVGTVIVAGVEPPPEPAVELLRSVNIRDGDDDYLKL